MGRGQANTGPCPGYCEGLITEDKGREAVKEGGVPLESGDFIRYM